jgi:hypothetical protein
MPMQQDDDDDNNKIVRKTTIHLVGKKICSWDRCVGRVVLCGVVWADVLQRRCVGCGIVSRSCRLVVTMTTMAVRRSTSSVVEGEGQQGRHNKGTTQGKRSASCGKLVVVFVFRRCCCCCVCVVPLWGLLRSGRGGDSAVWPGNGGMSYGGTVVFAVQRRTASCGLVDGNRFQKAREVKYVGSSVRGRYIR